MDRSQITWTSVEFNNETEFEDILKKNDVLKDYFVYNAKKTINIFKNYNRYADLLLIDKTYKYWVIAEVEISRHSFKNHIFPQLIEIYSLVDQNIESIRKSFLLIEDLPKNKEVEDLINFNKPFLNLVIDKIPSNYLNIIPLLNTFCNVNTVIRLKDSNENYVYINDDYFTDDIMNSTSSCYIKDRILFIDHPNIIGLNSKNFDYIDFNNDKFYFSHNVSLVNNLKTLYFILNDSIPNGKYKISSQSNYLILSK
jgi:hypothetical protein